jgi:hypothetical protein
MDSTSTPRWPIVNAVRQREWIIEITLIRDQVRNGGQKLTLTPSSTRTAGATPVTPAEATVGDLHGRA